MDPNGKNNAQENASDQLFRLMLVAMTFLLIGVVIGVTVTQLNYAIFTRALLSEESAISVMDASNIMPMTDVLDTPPMIGSPDAPVQIIMYSDFQCGFCRRFVQTTQVPLLMAYGDQIAISYRHFPVLGTVSLEAALASHCANDQGQFWAYHDALFATSPPLNRTSFLQIANTLGLAIEPFTACLNSRQYQSSIMRDQESGRMLGITGTPAFLINGELVIGAKPLAEFQRLIDAML